MRASSRDLCRRYYHTLQASLYSLHLRISRSLRLRRRFRSSFHDSCTPFWLQQDAIRSPVTLERMVERTTVAPALRAASAECRVHCDQNAPALAHLACFVHMTGQIPTCGSPYELRASGCGVGVFKDTGGPKTGSLDPPGSTALKFALV